MAQTISQENFYINKYILKIESNDKSKEIDIENSTCYYFDDVIKIEDFDLDNILTNEKLHGNVLVYNISYKNLIDS